MIYAHSFYLDNICPGWKALTGEKYEWVLPITYRKKWGINYLYQPAFTQQLGVFSKDDVVVPWKEIIEFLKTNFSFWEINWNYKTPPELLPVNIKTTESTNFILNLSSSYNEISQSFKHDLIKNINRSKKFRLIYSDQRDYKKAIQLYIENYKSKIAHVTDIDYERFEKICDTAFNNQQIICRQIVDENNQLMSIVLFLFDGRRLYNIMNTTTAIGRKKEANHFLIDEVIKEFSGRPIILDFEGSDLPGVKSFYENFGAVNQPYFMLKYNNLPWPLKLFKK